MKFELMWWLIAINLNMQLKFFFFSFSICLWHECIQISTRKKQKKCFSQNKIPFEWLSYLKCFDNNSAFHHLKFQFGKTNVSNCQQFFFCFLLMLVRSSLLLQSFRKSNILMSSKKQLKSVKGRFFQNEK